MHVFGKRVITLFKRETLREIPAADERPYPAVGKVFADGNNRFGGFFDFYIKSKITRTFDGHIDDNIHSVAAVRFKREGVGKNVALFPRRARHRNECARREICALRYLPRGVPAVFLKHTLRGNPRKLIVVKYRAGNRS